MPAVTPKPEAETQEPEPSPAPSYGELSAFLATHGVDLPAVPKIKSFRSAEEAMRHLLKTGLFETEKDR
jgi:hypothetical protein